MMRHHPAYQFVLPALIAGVCAVTPLAALAQSAPSNPPPGSTTTTTTTTYSEIIAPIAPPPVRVETIPPAPAPTMTWEPGHWTWNGSWIWTSGHYVERPSAQAVWEPDHWIEHGNGWMWVAGRWRVSGG